MPRTELEVSEGEENQRLDFFLAKKLAAELSRSRLKTLIQEGSVLVNGKPVKAHYAVRPGDRVAVEYVEKPPMDAGEENIPLTILHEDEEVIVIDKPAGMVIHPAQGNYEHTLVNALLYHTRGQLSSMGGMIRPGIVHRLDKDTSGVLVVAKSDFSHRSLAKQFKMHEVSKIYEAVVKGVVQHEELECQEPVGRAFVNRKKIVVKPSGGKDASTFFRVLERFKGASHLEVRPLTGRTHQIRVHLSYMGHPILGDSLYGGASDLIGRHALHARQLEFEHPRTKRRMTFKSPLPPDMKQLLVALRRLI